MEEQTRALPQAHASAIERCNVAYFPTCMSLTASCIFTASPGKVCLGQIEDHRLSAIQIYSAPDLSQLSYKEAPRTKPRPLPGFFCPESSLYPPLCRDTSWGLWEALMSFYLSTTEFLSTESPLRLNMSQMHC